MDVGLCVEDFLGWGWGCPVYCTVDLESGLGFWWYILRRSQAYTVKGTEVDVDIKLRVNA